jgi:hypothetical protein
MPNDFTIPSRLPSVSAAVAVKAESPAPAPMAKPAPLYVNPDIKFDPSVGLVVIEFHNDTGKLVDSIPNQRQLDAYRLHQTALPGEATPMKPDGETPSG